MRNVVSALGAVLLLVPAVAVAQAAPYQPPPPDEPYYPQNPPLVDSGEFFGGLGFGGFTSDLGALSSVGVAWTIRGGVNMFRYFGAELNYSGTSSSVNSVLPSGFVVVSGTDFTEQQITVNVKAGLPLLVGNRILRPYVLAGVGYGHIGVNNSFSLVGIPSENAAAFPFAAGLSYNITPGFVVDARYTYNVLTETIGNTWNVGFNLGAQFGSGG